MKKLQPTLMMKMPIFLLLHFGAITTMAFAQVLGFMLDI
jgi:hypothetical protein